MNETNMKILDPCGIIDEFYQTYNNVNSTQIFIFKMKRNMSQLATEDQHNLVKTIAATTTTTTNQVRQEQNNKPSKVGIERNVIDL